MFFPHDTKRPGQDTLMEDISEALTDGKTILTHAPTGLGKTAAALSEALAVAMEEDKVIFFLTNRHTQHQIAIDTLKKIKKKTGSDFHTVDLIGKRWMCNQSIAQMMGSDFNEYCKSLVEKGECEFYNNVKKKSALQVQAQVHIKDLQRQGPLHTGELIEQCQDKKMCSYEIAVAMSKNARIIIGDYYYMFNPHVQASILNKIERELQDIIVVVDEGHNLPNRVTEMMSNNLTTNMIKNGLVEAKKYRYDGIIVWLQDMMEILNNLVGDEEKTVTREQFTNALKIKIDYEELMNQLDLAAEEIRKKQRRSYLGGISAFLEAWEGPDEGFVRIIAEHRSKYGPIISLQYSCLDPALITRDIFKNIHSAIIMSGTLQPTFMYKDILGIDNGVMKDYTSPFPPENKVSLIVPDTSTKYTVRGDVMYKRIANHCSEIIKLTPGNVAIFFPSYYLRDSIAPFLSTKRKCFYEKNTMTKEEKQGLLQEFEAEKDVGGVLLGVSGANFAEGIDFPGDILKTVVVVGLPLAKPDLKTKSLITYYDTKYGKGWDYGYTFPAFSKCIQSAGRCIRSETDEGVVVYLDERFAWQRYYNCFPEKVGLIVSKEYSKIMAEFFS